MKQNADSSRDFLYKIPFIGRFFRWFACVHYETKTTLKTVENIAERVAVLQKIEETVYDIPKILSQLQKINGSLNFTHLVQENIGVLSDKIDALQMQLKYDQQQKQQIDLTVKDNLTELSEKINALQEQLHDSQQQKQLIDLKREIDQPTEAVELHYVNAQKLSCVLADNQKELLARTDVFAARANDAEQTGGARYNETIKQIQTLHETVIASSYMQEMRFDNYQKSSSIFNNRPRVHFIRCWCIYNTGDMNCGPELYFREFTEKYTCFFHSIKNVNFAIIEPNDWVILGGGGMLECNYVYQASIMHLLELSHRVISWAMGHNNHYQGYWAEWEISNAIDYSKFYLLTVRDWDYNQQRFCPDVSCMYSGFDKQFATKRKIGIVEHYDSPITEFDYEKCSNSHNIDNLLEFIGGSEVIITNTYHCAYWAILMGKKVILNNPFSNKFEFFKYAPVVYSGDLERDIETAQVYPKALSEFRQLNTHLKDEIIAAIDNTF